MPFVFRLNEPPCDAYYLSLIDAAALYNTDDVASGELKQETLRQVGWHPISMPAEWFLSDTARDTTRHVVELLQCTVQYLHHRQKNAEKQLRRLSESQRSCAEERDAAFEELVELRETVAALRRQAAEAVQRYRPGRSSQPAAGAQDGFSCALCGNLYPTAHSLRSHLQKRHKRGEAYAQKAVASAVLAAHMRTAQDELSPDAPPSTSGNDDPPTTADKQSVGRNESVAVAGLRGELTSMRELLVQFMVQQQQRQSASHSSAAPHSGANASFATPRAEVLLPCGNLPGAADALIPVSTTEGDAHRQSNTTSNAVIAAHDGALHELRGALEQVNCRLSQFEQVLTHLSTVQEATVQRLTTRPTTAGLAAATQTTRPQPLSLSTLHVYASPPPTQQQPSSAVLPVSQSATGTTSAPATPSLEVIVSPATEASHSALRAGSTTAHATKQPAVQLPLQQPTAFVHDNATKANSRYDSSDEEESVSRRSAVGRDMSTPHRTSVTNEPEKSVSPPKFVRTARKECAGRGEDGRRGMKQLPVALSVHDGSVLSRSEPIATPILTPLQTSATPPSSSHIALVDGDRGRNRRAADAQQETSETTPRSTHSSPLAPPSVLEVTPRSVTVDETLNNNNKTKKNSCSHLVGEAQTVTAREAMRISSQCASTAERSGSNASQSSLTSQGERLRGSTHDHRRGAVTRATTTPAAAAAAVVRDEDADKGGSENVGSPHTATEDAVRSFSSAANNTATNTHNVAAVVGAMPSSAPNTSQASLHQSMSQHSSTTAAQGIQAETRPPATSHEHDDKASSASSYSSSYSSSSSTSATATDGALGGHGEIAAHTQARDEAAVTTATASAALTSTPRVVATSQTGHEDDEAGSKPRAPVALRPTLTTPVPDSHGAAPALTVGHGDRPPRAASSPAPGGTSSFTGVSLSSTVGAGPTAGRVGKGRSSSASLTAVLDSGDGAKKDKKKRSFSASIKHFFQGKKFKKDKK